MSRRPLTHFIAALLFALLPATTLHTQDVTPVFKSRTRIVILDIVVTDRKGNVVTNLTKDDFTILEDKQPQTIQTFEPPSVHNMPPAPDGKPIVTSSADLPKIGNAPVTVIVLDELNTSFPNMSYGRRELANYLQKQPAVLKQPTSLLVIGNTRFQLLHDYTQNRDDLVKILQAHFPEYPFQSFDSTSGLAIANGVSIVDRIRQTMQALSQVVKSNSGTPGRKNIIWVGVNAPCIPLAGMNSQDRDAWGQLTRNMSQSMLEDRVTMYYIDPTMRGDEVRSYLKTCPNQADDYYTDAFTPADPFTSHTIYFDHFATLTGGRIFAFRNDISNEIATAIDNSAAYYTLSYSPTNKEEDETKYRVIKVQLSNPDLTARAREGYYPLPVNATNVVNTPNIPDAQREKLLLFDITQTAISPLPFNGLAVSVQKDTAGQNWQVTISNKDVSWTTQPDGNVQAEFTAVAVALDAKNNVLAKTSHEKVSDRSIGSPAPQSIVFQLPVEAPAGTTRVRVIVRDAVTGKIGTADVKP